MPKKFIFFCFLVFSYFLHCIDYTNTLHEIRLKYNFHTFEAQLTQFNYFSEHDLSLESHGTVFIMENTCVIEYTDPTYQFIKISETSMITYLQDQNVAYYSRDLDVLKTANRLNFSYLLEGNLVYLKTEENLLVFQYSADWNIGFNTLIYICPEEIEIRKLSYADDTKDITTIDIHNQQFNQPLSKSIQSFEIPAEATIIE